DDAEIGTEPVAERLLERLRTVADDDDARRLEPEAKRLSREERAVPVRALTADELAARDDERRSRPACARQAAARTRLKPRTVTITARPVGKTRRCPFRVSVRWRGAPARTHMRFPHSEIACLPGSSVPAQSSLPLAEFRYTSRRHPPPTAFRTRCAETGTARCFFVAGGFELSRFAMCPLCEPPNFHARMKSATTATIPPTVSTTTRESTCRSVRPAVDRRGRATGSSSPTT